MTVDLNTNVVSCRCSTDKCYCIHTTVAKWYLKQQMPSQFTSASKENDDEGESSEILKRRTGNKTIYYTMVIFCQKLFHQVFQDAMKFNTNNKLIKELFQSRLCVTYARDFWQVKCLPAARFMKLFYYMANLMLKTRRSCVL